MSDSTTVQKTNTKEETLMLKPSKGWVSLNLGDLWRYRELVYFLTWRDILVRYKQTLLGAAWAIINPLMQMVVFNFLFGNMANISTGDIPRPVFTFAALLPWNLFSNAIGNAGRSLVTNRNMITKVYFPRLVVPISSVFGGLVDFMIAFVILLGMMVYYQVQFTSTVWALLPFILLVLVASLGVGLWLSAWNLHYRDVRYFIPFMTQFWMLATPIAYPLSEIPAQWQTLYSVNPMVAVAEGFRWALAGGPPVEPFALMSSIIISLILLVSGLFYFRRMERTFADTV
ncbi:MAG TPA: ABC transporter permease [Anaerolineales bacterium]|nr:ABC transporter permease [Anaerolineales bacterium]